MAYPLQCIHRSLRQILCLLPALLLFTPACSSPQREVVRSIVEGVEVVSNPENPLTLHGKPRRLDFEHIRDYPGNEEDPDFRFALGSVAIGPDGSIFINDAPQYRILKYDADWNFLFSMGRRGAGPGEFLEVAWMGLTPEGVIHASDEQNRRTVLFDAETGDFLDMIVYPHPGFRRASMLGSERLFAIYHSWVREREEIVFRWGVFDRSFEPVNLLIDRLDAALGDVTGISRPEWLGRMDAQVPEPSLIFNVTVHGELLAGPDFEYSFSLYDSMGEEVRRIEREGPPSLLTEADRREIIDMNIRRWERYNEPGIANAAVQYLEFPEHRPAYVGIYDFDRRGFILVTIPDENWVYWLEIYGRDGTYMAKQPFTQFSEIFQIAGDTLYVALEDELGNAMLSSYRIRYLAGEGEDAREVTWQEWFGSGR